MSRAFASTLILLCVATSTGVAKDFVANPPKHAKPPAPGDWVKVESETYHFTFSVPKTWQLQGADGSDTFDLTPPKMKEKGKNLGTLHIVASKLPQGTLETKVADLRESLPKDSGGGKLVKDEAFTVGNQTGWTFVVEVSHKTQETTPSSVEGQPGFTHDVVKKSRTWYAVTVANGVLYEATFAAEGGAFSGGLSTVTRVMDSFLFTTPAVPAADAGTADKK